MDRFGFDKMVIIQHQNNPGLGSRKVINEEGQERGKGWRLSAAGLEHVQRRLPDVSFNLP
jgi:hypothetical protein